MPEIKLLLLIMAANGAPVLLRWWLGERFARPIDNGLMLADGRPLLGKSKTWRGLLGALVSTPVVALLLGLDAGTGLLIAVLAMLGDLFSSFLKRRIGIPPSGIAPGLDQIPESLLPLWVLKPALGLDWQRILWIVVTFIVVGYVLSFLLYRLHIRKHPY